MKRHHVWALYAFCRHADDIVDDLGPVAVEVREKALADFGDRFFADLDAGRSDDPVLKAVVHTVRAFDIDPDCFRRFLRSMAMDLTVTELRHVGRPARLHGRLGGGDRRDDAADPRAARPRTRSSHARDLGNAFQLTNFLRDVAEDLDRGRVYLPQEDLDRFGADPRRRIVDEPWRERDAFEIDRGRGALPIGRPRRRACCRRRRPAASRPPARSTPRSSTASRRADYDVFTAAGHACRPGARPSLAGRMMLPRER